MKRQALETANSAGGVRLDIWLWAARFFKTRALAKQAIEGGKIRVGDATGKPAKLVRIGDRVQISRGEDRYEIDVIALHAQRGSAAIARSCYCETEASAFRA